MRAHMRTLIATPPRLALQEADKMREEALRDADATREECTRDGTVDEKSVAIAAHHL